MKSLPQIEICGCEIQIDYSHGQGHCWRPADNIDCPESVQEEIAGEIIDGGVESCKSFRASNGEYYRW